ncbi:MAG: WXG100 family type VII secretion target [Actinocatenispora sp.]
MPSDELAYDFAGIDNVKGLITAFVSDMNEQLGAVDKKFTSLIHDGWQGKAADQFHARSQEWHKQAGNMAQTLHQLSNAVGNAGVNMAAADAAAAAKF